MTWNAVPAGRRERCRGLQGKPQKMPELKIALLDWFVDIRESVRGRLPLRAVLAQASILCQAGVAADIAAGNVPDPPHLCSMWAYRWRKPFGISMKNPNKRFKIKASVFKARVKATWKDSIAARYFIIKLCGKDPIQENADEKGLHLNEAGSKNCGTLAFGGVERVELLEHHSQTRERVSLMGWCTSDMSVSGRPASFLDFCLKGKTDAILKDLASPSGNPDQYTFQVAEKGSYRVEHILVYIRRHTLPATEERTRTNDWRMFWMDAAAQHLKEDVLVLLWSRMYVKMDIRGGVTGFMQGCDTDEFGPFEREYLVCEQLQAFWDLRIRGHKGAKHKQTAVYKSVRECVGKHDARAGREVFHTEWVHESVGPACRGRLAKRNFSNVE